MPELGQKTDARAITEREIEAHFRLMCQAFDLDENVAHPIYFRDPFFDISLKRVLVDRSSEELISCLTMVPATIRIAGGVTVPIAGLAGVGTRPDLRGHGFASALLAATTKHSIDLGYPMLALVTNRPDYYRRFGWECCATAYDWAALASQLPAYTEGLAVRVLSGPELSAHADSIHTLHERAHTGQVGSLVRDIRRWFCIETFSHGRQVAIFEVGRHSEAYVAFEERTEDGTESTLVQEMIAVTEAGRRALVGFLARRDGPIRGRMSGSDFAAFGLDRQTGIEVVLAEGMMLRVTDLSRCLSAVAQSGFYTPILQKHPSGLTIRIDNARLSENNKPIRLFPIVDKDRVSRLAMSPADEIEGLWISADVGAFTQLFIGYRTATQLRSEGRLRASNAQAVLVADHLFPPSDPLLALPDTF